MENRIRVASPILLGVVGDTHTSPTRPGHSLEPVVEFFRRAHVGLILHAGDAGHASVLQSLERAASTVAVRATLTRSIHRDASRPRLDRGGLAHRAAVAWTLRQDGVESGPGGRCSRRRFDRLRAQPQTAHRPGRANHSIQSGFTNGTPLESPLRCRTRPSLGCRDQNPSSSCSTIFVT